MNDQEKREKVIKGLELCGYQEGMPQCDSCPYDGKQCWKRLKTDALALLKAQEPRVMTLEEIRLANGGDVWLELSGNIAEDVLFAATIDGCGTKGVHTRYEALDYKMYGVKPYGWRCWTSRPTDKQREAVKWE